MPNILSDSIKLTQVSLTDDKQLNFIANVGKYMTHPSSKAQTLLLKLFIKV